MAQLRWLTALFLCFALSSLAQQISPPSETTGQSTAPARTPPIALIPRSHEERENRYQAEHRILLNVLVTNASGQPMTGLKQEDFTILDDGQPQKVASFRASREVSALRQFASCSC